MYDTLRFDEFSGLNVKELIILDEVPIYSYMNIKYKELTSEMEVIIKMLKSDGTIDKLRENALNTMK